jgi:hypothetical protein
VGISDQLFPVLSGTRPINAIKYVRTARQGAFVPAIMNGTLWRRSYDGVSEEPGGDGGYATGKLYGDLGTLTAPVICVEPLIFLESRIS